MGWGGHTPPNPALFCRAVLCPTQRAGVELGCSPRLEGSAPNVGLERDNTRVPVGLGTRDTSRGGDACTPHEGRAFLGCWVCVRACGH